MSLKSLKAMVSTACSKQGALVDEAVGYLDEMEESSTPSPPTKSFDFRGFDSSRLLILKGGNSHVRIIL